MKNDNFPSHKNLLYSLIFSISNFEELYNYLAEIFKLEEKFFFYFFDDGENE